MNNQISGYQLIIYYIGLFLIAIGFIILLPLLMLIFYRNEIQYAYCFLIPGIISIFIGYLINFFFKKKKPVNLENHQDVVLVVFIWIILIFVSSFPFLLTGKIGFTRAIFEVTSGYTTTGLSVIDVASCPKIFLFYRSLTLFVGGVGFVLIVTSAISDKLRLNIYEAEGHNDKLLPNFIKSSRLIFALYFGYIVLGTIMYLCCGMDLFDAVNHSIAALSTGGFSTKAGNIYEFHSLGVEIVSILLMLLGGTNFVIHIFLLKRKFKTVFFHCETIFSFLIIILFSIISISIFYGTNFECDSNNVMVVIFQLVSALTTTGFQNISSISILPHFFIGIMIMFMLIGGEMGSTAGGIKQFRIISCLKGIGDYIAKSFKNRKIIHHSLLRKDEQIIYLDDNNLSANYAFVFTYLLLFLIGSLIFSSFGYSMEESMFDFASCLSTVGLSCGVITMYSSNVVLWTAIIGMYLGRLEIFAVIYTIINLSSRK